MSLTLPPGVTIQHVRHYRYLPTCTKRSLEKLNNEYECKEVSSMSTYATRYSEYDSLITFVLRKGKTIVGWAIARFGGDFGMDSYEFNVYVKPAFRSRGYGTLLVKAARAKLRRRLTGASWCNEARAFFESVNIEDY